MRRRATRWTQQGALVVFDGASAVIERPVDVVPQESSTGSSAGVRSFCSCPGKPRCLCESAAQRGFAWVEQAKLAATEAGYSVAAAKVKLR